MAKASQAPRIDLPYADYDGSAEILVSDVDLHKGDEAQLRWILDFVIHVPDGYEPGLPGVGDARSHAKNGRGSGKCEHTPKNAIVKLSLFDPSDGGDQANPVLEVDGAKIRFVKFAVTDKGETLRVRVAFPGLSIQHSAELLNCIGRTCRFTTVPAQQALALAS